MVGTAGMAGMYLTDCTRLIVDGVHEKLFNQDDIASDYAMAIKSEAAGVDQPDWSAINQAILDRWKERGLAAVKRKAWALVRPANRA